MNSKPKVIRNKRPKWNQNKSNNFINNIDRSKLDNINTNIETLKANINNVNKETINSISSDISALFSESSDKTYPIEQLAINPKNDRKHKPWFGINCQNARKKYHIARRIHNLNRSHTNKANLKQQSTAYKRTLNLHINKHKRAAQKKLRNLKSKSPKDFWKVINSINKKQEDTTISLDTLYDYFKTLNTTNETEDNQFSEEFTLDNSDDEELLNSSITEGEILKCINSLKNNKSSANDRIINEYLKTTANLMLPIYVSYFNLIFDTGIIPDTWLEGIIRPIYKKNGDPLKPENYRPITILSCFGKLFTAVLNQRLYNYLTSYEILKENQAGFRAGYSTFDHIFSLYALIELLKAKNKKLYCCFIDFRKAFDSVWRIGLWMKMLGNGINGKIFNVIFNLYKNIKSCVSLNGNQSVFFNSFLGLRQGENLSPVLFAIFLNDLEEFLVQQNCSGINLTLQDDQLTVYFKLLVLLYADDTVIFGTDPESFQHNLDCFYEYSDRWKLNINFDKTKIMIFGIRNTDRLQFKLNETVITICDEFKYLGVVFSKSRSFHKTIKHNVEHSKKALHILYRKIRHLNLPIDLQIYLFDHTITPILLYGCEVWCFQNTQLLETVHNQFLRNITSLRKSTPIYMLHAELGRHTLDINIKSRAIGYWISFINSPNNKISKTLYNILYNETLLGRTNSKWLNYIKDILTSVGKPHLFYQQQIFNPNSTKNLIVQTLKDQHIQNWNSKLQESNKGRNYSIYKEDIIMEYYLKNSFKSIYVPILRFRTANHKLPVEKGRWENIPYEDRKCQACDKNEIGDEFHYLFTCPAFSNERTHLIKPYYYNRPNILKLKQLMQSRNKNTLMNLSKFLKHIMTIIN